MLYIELLISKSAAFEQCSTLSSDLIASITVLFFSMEYVTTKFLLTFNQYKSHL